MFHFKSTLTLFQIWNLHMVVNSQLTTYIEVKDFVIGWKWLNASVLGFVILYLVLGQSVCVGAHVLKFGYDAVTLMGVSSVHDVLAQGVKIRKKG